MDAFASRAAISPTRAATPLASALRQSVALILAVLLLFAACLLLSRRLAGGLNFPLSASALFGIAILSVILAETIHRLSHINTTLANSTASFFTHWSPRIALPLLALAISLPGSSLTGLFFLWLAIIGEALRQSRAHTVTTLRRIQISPPPEPSDELSPTADWRDRAAAQQITYRQTADGNQIVQGFSRARFAVQQRTAVVHVAFCPPFHAAPHIEAEPLDGPPCDIRATLILPWGVRWEIKLNAEAAAPTFVVIGFFATQPAPEQTAPKPTPLKQTSPPS